MNDLSQQVRHILRKLVRAPLFTITTVGTLALGIGANAAIFTIVNGVLLKPLPFEDPDELVGLWHVAPGLGFDESRPVNMAPAMYFTYRDEGRAFEEVGSWDEEQVSVTGLAQPEQLSAMRVTAGLLPLLGVQPLIGRRFTEEDDSPGAAQNDHAEPSVLATAVRRRSGDLAQVQGVVATARC